MEKITINEFIQATNRLETYYQKEYTKEQLKIMYEELKIHSLDRYKLLISKAIQQCKFLPKVADLIQINKESPFKNSEEERAEKIECKRCNSTGYVLYDKLVNNGNEKLKYTFMAVCQCGNVKQYKGWEISEKEHRTNYYTPMAQELGL